MHLIYLIVSSNLVPLPFQMIRPLKCLTVEPASMSATRVNCHDCYGFSHTA